MDRQADRCNRGGLLSTILSINQKLFFYPEERKQSGKGK